MAGPATIDIEFQVRDEQIKAMTERVVEVNKHIALLIDHLIAQNRRLTALEEQLAAETP